MPSPWQWFMVVLCFWARPLALLLLLRSLKCTPRRETISPCLCTTCPLSVSLCHCHPCQGSHHHHHSLPNSYRVVVYLKLKPDSLTSFTVDFGEQNKSFCSRIKNYTSFHWVKGIFGWRFAHTVQLIVTRISKQSAFAFCGSWTFLPQNVLFDS